MSFKFRLPEMAKKKGIENAFQLSNILKVSPRTGRRLWNGELERVYIETLHRLCELLDCQISDFLEWDGKKLK